MRNFETTSSNFVAGVNISNNAEGLSLIHNHDCAAAIWQRGPLSGFQSWIDELDESNLPKARVVLPVLKVRDAVNEICDMCGSSDCPERNLFVEDASRLAIIFSNIMQSPHVQLRFDVITNNACSKFHTDAVTARLVCTYRGAGTQYGTLSGHGEPEDIFNLPTGSAMILRGTRWPENPMSNLKHRSPPIEGKGEARLLLVLDPVMDGDNSSAMH